MFQNLLNSETKDFDLMVFEMLPLYECFLPLAEKLGVPIIATFSLRPWLFIDTEFGNPHSLLVPSCLSSFSHKLTSFAERLRNTLEEIYAHIMMIYFWNPSINKVYQQYFPNYHSPKKQLSLLFSNNHASIFPTPVAPNVIDVSGIHLKPIKPLPQVRHFVLQDNTALLSSSPILLIFSVMLPTGK